MAVDYNSLIKKYQKQLFESPTAYNPGSTPTQADISADASLRKIQSQKAFESGRQASEQWYGDSNEDNEEPGGVSGLKKVLHTLGTPLYGITGGIEAILGKGTESGIGNILANVKEEGTMGDLLRSYGINNFFAMPAGLALDIMIDPVSWGTLGTEAIIPRIASGAYSGIKGGEGLVTGTKLAAESGLLNKLEMAGRMMPGLRKSAFNADSAAYENKIPSMYRDLAERASSKQEDFERMMGKTFDEKLSNIYNSGTKLNRLGAKIQNKFGTEEGSLGQKLIDFVSYDPSKQFNKSKALDIELSSEALGIPEHKMQDIINGVDLSGSNEIFENNLSAAEHIMNNSYRAENVDDLLDGMKIQSRAEMRFKKNIEEVEKDLKNRVLNKDPETMEKLEEMGVDYEKALTMFKSMKTGLDSIDRSTARIIASPLGKKTLETYQKLIGAFKAIKIGGNLPASATNATAGDVLMTNMIGVDILNNGLLSSMKKAVKMIANPDEARKFYGTEPEFRSFIDKYPDTWYGEIGINPSFMRNPFSFIDNVAEEIAQKMPSKMGKYTGDLAKEKEEIGRELYAAINKNKKNATSLTEAQRNNISGTTMVAENMAGSFGDFLKSLEAKSKKGNSLASALYWSLTKPMEAYGKIDQGFRLGLTMHLAKNGISRAELLRIARRVPIGPDDYKKISGRNSYKLTVDKAMEVANVTYMNYAAMPGFVQLMRVLPFLGSPFFSFTYGMGVNTLNTALSNPAFFNKVQFLLKEISGQKSPLEKEALQSRYSSWLNQPGMVKLPFFKDNPVFLNMTNMIPYYTLNMFQPMGRSYSERFGNTVAGIIDKSPFLKTPEGQLLFDYGIQPMILSSAEPKGMFNQQLYPKDAKNLEKAMYAARSASEIFTPPVLGYLGAITPSGQSGEDVIPYLPSYSWRKVAYARRGKTAVGANTKTDPAELTGRALLALSGWPLYSVKLKYNK
jgi:hypothetical protein